MARYGQAFKDKAVARLLPPESADVVVVSREIGVSVATLERWRADALASGKKSGGWTAAARFEAVLTTAALSEEARCSQTWTPTILAMRERLRLASVQR